MNRKTKRLQKDGKDNARKIDAGKQKKPEKTKIA